MLASKNKTIKLSVMFIALALLSPENLRAASEEKTTATTQESVKSAGEESTKAVNEENAKAPEQGFNCYCACWHQGTDCLQKFKYPPLLTAANCLDKCGGDIVISCELSVWNQCKGPIVSAKAAASK